MFAQSPARVEQFVGGPMRQAIAGQPGRQFSAQGVGVMRQGVGAFRGQNSSAGRASAEIPPLVLRVGAEPFRGYGHDPESGDSRRASASCALTGTYRSCVRRMSAVITQPPSERALQLSITSKVSGAWTETVGAGPMAVATP